MEQENFMKLNKKGQVQGAIGAMIALFVGVIVIVLLVILAGALGGQTYNLVQDDIQDINDSTIQGNVENSIKEGFSTLEDTAGYVPIVVLAIIIFLVLTLVIGFTALTGGVQNGGTAL